MSHIFYRKHYINLIERFNNINLTYHSIDFELNKLSLNQTHIDLMTQMSFQLYDKYREFFSVTREMFVERFATFNIPLMVFGIFVLFASCCINLIFILQNKLFLNYKLKDVFFVAVSCVMFCAGHFSVNYIKNEKLCVYFLLILNQIFVLFTEIRNLRSLTKFAVFLFSLGILNYITIQRERIN